MQIRVVPPKTRLSAENGDKSTRFVLEQDNWNDYRFQTQYHLHIVDPVSVTFVGTVKILKRGQSEKDGIQFPVGVLAPLSEEFCSLGQSLDYYERIAALPEDQRAYILVALRDVIYTPSLREAFSAEPGWRISLLRDVKEDDALFALGPVVLSRRFETLPKSELKFSFRLPTWDEPITFSFQAPTVLRGFFNENLLPSRVSVLIGRNGSGKSTLLARIGRILHATSAEREESALQSLGIVDPPGLGFPRILTVSYSAFDSFRLPGVNRRDQEQIAKDVEVGEGRFIFCGLRDVVRELREELGATEEAVSLGDRSTRTFLKPIEQLAGEYVHTVRRIKERGRIGRLNSAMQPLLKEPSFAGVKEVLQKEIETEGSTRDDFMAWGTGLKISVQVVLSLVAYTEPRSLVLIDEPETHLHPPLLAALMHAVREILGASEAFAILATHSPVVLQETLSRHVHVIRREGDAIHIAQPGMEVFAENIGDITSEVFGLNSDVTDFHKVLDILATLRASVEEIEALFDRGLSAQARAYLMSVYANRKQGG